MPRISDKELKTQEFRDRLNEADEYAARRGLDMWAARIVWIGLIYNALGVKRYAERRGNYQNSQAWACYTRLVETGILIEEDPQEGIAWTPGTAPWEADTLRWFDDLCRIAAGGAIPKGFPVHSPRMVARRGQPEVTSTVLRVVGA